MKGPQSRAGLETARQGWGSEQGGWGYNLSQSDPSVALRACSSSPRTHPSVAQGALSLRPFGLCSCASLCCPPPPPPQLPRPISNVLVPHAQWQPLAFIKLTCVCSFYSLEASRGLGCSLLLFGRPAPGLRHGRPTTRAGEGPQEQTNVAILHKDLDSHQPALDRYHSSQALPCRWPASLGCRLGVLPPMFTAGSGGAILRAESVCDISPRSPQYLERHLACGRRL